MSQIVRVKTMWCVVVASLCAATNVIAERQLLWGDTHLHTTYSSDAFSNNNLTATPDTAYRYAKGLPVIHPYHQGRVQIETPLDFLVVSDHAEYMGVIRNVYFNGIDGTHLGLWDRLVGRYAEWVLRDAVEKREARKLFFEFLPEPIDDPVEAARDWVGSSAQSLVALTCTALSYPISTAIRHRHFNPTALIKACIQRNYGSGLSKPVQ
jgi:hypothetical protein